MKPSIQKLILSALNNYLIHFHNRLVSYSDLLSFLSPNSNCSMHTVQTLTSFLHTTHTSAQQLIQLLHTPLFFLGYDRYDNNTLSLRDPFQRTMKCLLRKTTAGYLVHASLAHSTKPFFHPLLSPVIIYIYIYSDMSVIADLYTSYPFAVHNFLRDISTISPILDHLDCRKNLRL